MAHYCDIHKTPFFKSQKMKRYAHPIMDADGNSTGEWCNEPKEQTEAQPQKQYSSGYKGKSPEELELSRRSYALSYAKDLAVAEKIEVKQIVFFAIEFYKWLVVEVNPTTSAVKGEPKMPLLTDEEVKEVLASSGMAIPEGETSKQPLDLYKGDDGIKPPPDEPEPIATEQKERLKELQEKLPGRMKELCILWGWNVKAISKLTKDQANHLIEVMDREAKN